MAAHTHRQHDYFLVENAKALQSDILDEWRPICKQMGIKNPKVWLEETEHGFVIRSNMVNGMPRGLSPDVS